MAYIFYSFFSKSKVMVGYCLEMKLNPGELEWILFCEVSKLVSYLIVLKEL